MLGYALDCLDSILGGRGDGDFYLWGHLKNEVYATNPHTLEELKASIRRKIDCISVPVIELMHVDTHILKRCKKCVDEGEQHF